MNKRGHRQHGAITVFLSIVLIAIIAFMGMLVDLSRMRVAQAQLKRASQLSLDAVMTSYSRRLREDYGLFGYAGGDADSVNSVYMDYLKANLDPTQTEEKGEYVKLLQTITGVQDVKYGDMLKLSAGDGTSGTGRDPLSDPDVLFHQVMEFSKFRVPIHMLASDTLGKIENMQDEMNAAEEENKAYNKMNELGKPMEEYYGDCGELQEKVEALQKAVNELNTAISWWNQLLNGSSDEEIRVGDSLTVTYSKYIADEIYDDYMQIIGWALIDDSMTISKTVSVTAYTTNETASAFQKVWNELDADMVEAIVGDYEKALVYEENSLFDLYNSVSEEEQQTIYYLIEQNHNLQNELPDLEGDAREASYQIQADTYKKLWEKFQDELKIRTQEYYELYDEELKKVRSAYGEVEQAIQNLNSGSEKVKGTMGNIDSELGDVNEYIQDEWGKSKESTNNTMEDDQRKVEELRGKLEELSRQLDEAAQNNSFDLPSIVQSFMYSGVQKKISDEEISWKPSDYKMQTVNFGGEFVVAVSSEEYEEKKNDVDKNKNKANDELKKMEQSQDDKDRYNKERIPEKYKNLFVQAEERNDNATEQEDLGDPKDVSADEASNKGNSMFSGFQDLTEMLNDGVQYVLGAVYGSEYILTMFSNAAPEQEDNKYDSQNFEYARITTLRNAMPVGKLDYAEMKDGETQLRPGYFYNAEAEYILFGYDDEQTNVTRGQVLLQVLFTAANYLQVRRNTALKGAVEAAAAAGAAICIPPTVTKFVLYLGLAIVESQFDMFYIMRGYSIPVFSRDGNKLFMMNLGNPNEVLGEKGFKLSYEFYLRLRLMYALTFYRDSVMKHMANLITLNVNYAADEGMGDAYDGDKGFTMKNAYTTFEANASAKMPYWFMTMAMMGEAQTDSKWYLVPEDKIISSY